MSIKAFQFKHLSSFPELFHGFTLNDPPLTFGNPDFHSPSVIEKNRATLIKEWNLPSIAYMHQVHSTDVVAITKEALREKRQCDGLCTQEKGITLFSISADCQPVLFYDPVNKVIANVHAGWRGQMAGILKNAVLKMHTLYGTKSEHLLVGIGPSLGPEASEFIHYKKEIPQKYWSFQWKPNYFNLWEISKAQLKEAGVLEEHIEIAGISTYSEKELCFSHRRDPASGRHAMVIYLKT